MAMGESRFMEPLQLAGRLIMENGGETYRAELGRGLRLRVPVPCRGGKGKLHPGPGV